jgi:hypothetical protein
MLGITHQAAGLFFLFTVFFSHWKIVLCLTEFGNVEGLEKIGGLHC